MNEGKPPRSFGVIFDLDGTLADTLDDITDSINVAFERVGVEPVTRERIRGAIGEGLRNLLRRTAQIDEPDQLETLIESYRVVYRERMLVRTRLYPGISNMLDGLVRLGVPMSVLSNKPDEFTVPICQTLLSRWSFVRFRGSQKEAERKPDPTLARRLAEEMRRAPANVFFVGDSSVDVLTGRAAGMTPVAVTWGYRARTAVELSAPTHWVDQPEQLINLLQ
jgi:phosphoglycolate phosphatase